MAIFDGASWIWTEKECKNQYVEFHNTFDCAGGDGAEMYISADNEYAVFINGAFAGFNQYDDFPDHKSYDKLDISAFVKPGSNEMLIRAYHQGENSFQYLPGPAGLIFVVCAGGARVCSGADVQAREYALYESGEIEKISSQLAYTFHCDASRVSDDWESVRVVTARSNTVLYERPIKKLDIGAPAETSLKNSGVFALRGGDTPAQRMQRAFLAPGSDEAGADGAFYIFDLGGEEAGLVTFDIDCPVGAEILVGYGEHLDDMRVRTFVGGRNFAFSYTAVAGKNAFTHYFKRIAGRYLEAFVPFGAKINSLTLMPVTYPVSERGAFSCTDSIMDDIFTVSRRTLRLCMHEHYEDSPWREQGLYAMDSRNQSLCGYLAFGEADFAQACLALMAEGRRPDGLLEICAPAKSTITIPSFSLGWIIMLRDFALYTGRVEEAGKLLPAAMDMLGFFKNRMADGLTVTPTEKEFWNFYEWAPGLDDGWDYGKGFENHGSRRDAPLNLFFALATECAAQVAGWAGMEDEAARLRDEARALNAEINARFWNEEMGAYRTYTDTPEHYCELTQSLALLSGAVTGTRARVLREKLAACDPAFIPTTLSYALFKYEALIMDADFRAAAVRDARDKWGYMLRAGATSFWETIEGADAFADAGSLCHGWSAAPAWLLFAGALGIMPVEPGFKSFTFSPLPGLDARAVVPTPFGDMKVTGSEIAYDTNNQTLVK